jgi:DNA topoisomerase-2
MHLFDDKDTLHKYESVVEIIDAYYEVRLKMYQERKEYMINALERELRLLSNKAKYITENLEGTIDLRKKKKEQVIQMLQEKGYENLDGDNEYKYLVKMPMDSVAEENVERLLKEKGNKELELETIKDTTIYKMWGDELDNLIKIYLEYKLERTKLMNGEEINQTKKKTLTSTKVSIKKSVKKQLLVVDED